MAVDMSKIPPKDQKHLDEIKKLFEQGLSAAAEDPERVQKLRDERNKMIKPWEDAIKIWNMDDDELKKRKDSEGKGKGKEKKAATSDDYAALRTFRAAVQQKQQEDEEQD